MKVVFADSVYWIAIVKPNDSWAEDAKRARKSVGESLLVTTDEVLAEFLNALSKGGPMLRRQAVKMVETILENPNVTTVPQTRDGFLDGLKLYEGREDKQYSLADCVSMNVMKSRSLTQALTNDHHYEQEGFDVLMQRSE